VAGRWLSGSLDDAGPKAAKVDTTVAHISRVYDYWLGGKDNFAVDRIAAERVIAAYPDIVRSARGNRVFLGRAVRYLVREAGIRQFLDIGTGLPAANNTHEVAQRAAPECRVVYVDNDPVVLSHAKALLASGPEGATAYVDADLRDPETILAAAAEVLDFSRPVAVMLVAILQHIGDHDDRYGIVARLVAEIPPGSYVALSHPARDIQATAMAEIADRMNELVAEKVTFRTRAEVLRFLDGLELIEPGVVPVPQWRPESDLEAASPTVMWGGVGRKS
jgi:O-methyltransferase involved in polyketide biosynthesis